MTMAVKKGTAADPAADVGRCAYVRESNRTRKFRPWNSKLFNWLTA
eukprot:CAMPEP_0170288580 /NCGR_PEP_ID=MMETSP0116_2-20130129/44352_1 /TAXON_ID=400756 /ORGANISM="Durinskia baltica, Strain CSIRO CS-38" /LENGTH=45 /DNA_ID= /DNA_START= /DNA_END= /DNA_ORIENTATION=